MTRSDLLALLARRPLVASVQASPGSPLADADCLVRLAQASLSQGVGLLRLEGVEAIRAVRAATGAPCIGLIKRDGRITPAIEDVAALAECEAIAFDATLRERSAPVVEMVAAVHALGRVAIADCDEIASIEAARKAGADLVATTLAGYTGGATPEGPDLELVRQAAPGGPLLAEGRYTEPWQVQAALRAGACGVVVGGALNDPVKQTARLAAAAEVFSEPIAAFDLGGTWIRYGRLGTDHWEDQDHAPMPPNAADRLAWMRARVGDAARVGVSSGGVVDPRTLMVTSAKEIIPGHGGFVFALGAPTVALNDGLAQAWGNACHPRYAGRRVATLALGTGVGAGFVAEQRLWIGAGGDYPRVNELAAPEGGTIEEALGGATLGDRARARAAAAYAITTMRSLWAPQDIVVCGSIGLSDWLMPDADPSPYGADAGLWGAAWLARRPPPGVVPIRVG
jgi:N-acetylmannosamine-6-phosphate 2-epimerase/N-acetylmannosamine kinase